MFVLLAGDLDGVQKVSACLEHGFGVEKDEVHALLLYEKAALAGSAVAQNNIGTMLLDGRGVARNPSLAASWFECVFTFRKMSCAHL